MHSCVCVCRWVCVCLYVCVCVCISVCVCVLIKQKNPTGVQGPSTKTYSMYVGKSKYSYGLEGKAIAFLWHAEILVASR